MLDIVITYKIGNYEFVALYKMYRFLGRSTGILERCDINGGGGEEKNDKGWWLITCIYNVSSYLISLILMLILCNYDACYLNFYEFSPLVCHYTKVHIYA